MNCYLISPDVSPNVGTGFELRPLSDKETELTRDSWQHPRDIKLTPDFNFSSCTRSAVNKSAAIVNTPFDIPNVIGDLTISAKSAPALCDALKSAIDDLGSSICDFIEIPEIWNRLAGWSKIEKKFF
ncbi:MAG: hypothetical protein AAGM38_09270 [Pseudomonadota bacterium]